ncbi:MAG: hypothetical protein WC548_01975 [Candidatus Pacearchaeota archaeon]
MVLDSVDWIFIGIIVICFILLVLVLLYHWAVSSMKKKETFENPDIISLKQEAESSEPNQNSEVKKEEPTIYTYDNVGLDQD